MIIKINKFKPHANKFFYEGRVSIDGKNYLFELQDNDNNTKEQIIITWKDKPKEVKVVESIIITEYRKND